MTSRAKLTRIQLNRGFMRGLHEATHEPSADRLEGPLLKIEWAKQHIRDLQAGIAAYVNRKPYSLVLERDRDTEGVAWVFRVREQVPKNFPLFIGDAVHNMRASLDLLANVIVTKPLDRMNVAFPIAKDARGLEDAIKRREIDRGGKDVVDLVRSLKPYTGGNEALCAIRDLDDADKHRLILPVVNHSVVPRLDVISGGGKQFPLISMKNVKFGIKDGLKTIVLPPTAQNEIGEEIETAFDITFDRGMPYERQAVVPTLIHLAEYVEGVVESFRPLL